LALADDTSRQVIVAETPRLQINAFLDTELPLVANAFYQLVYMPVSLSTDGDKCAMVNFGGNQLKV